MADVGVEVVEPVSDGHVNSKDNKWLAEYGDAVEAADDDSGYRNLVNKLSQDEINIPLVNELRVLFPDLKQLAELGGLSKNELIRTQLKKALLSGNKEVIGKLAVDLQGEFRETLHKRSPETAGLRDQIRGKQILARQAANSLHISVLNDGNESRVFDAYNWEQVLSSPPKERVTAPKASASGNSASPFTDNAQQFATQASTTLVPAR